jgi:hypothetical protein
MTAKTCCICQEEKPVAAFAKDRAPRDGLSSRCRVCEKQRRDSYKERPGTKEAIAAYQHQYRRAHRKPPPHQPSQRGGERNSNHVLTWELVYEIRQRYAQEGIGYLRLAREYDVAVNTIAQVIRRKTWIEES